MRNKPAAPSDVDVIRQLFDAFVQAVERADLDGFLALHSPLGAARADAGLFERNARKAREHGFRFELQGITVDGDVATVRFLVTPRDEDEPHRDDAEMTLERTPSGWAILEV